MIYVHITNMHIYSVIDRVSPSSRSRNEFYEILNESGVDPVTYVKDMLLYNSSNYVKPNSVYSPISPSEIDEMLSNLPPFFTIHTYDKILIGDKIDMIFGTNPDSCSEFTKFTSDFYANLEVRFMNKRGGDDLDIVLFREVVSLIEHLIFQIEQSIALSLQSSEILDDLLVLLLESSRTGIYAVIF